jgi:hypothetical protein
MLVPNGTGQAELEPFNSAQFMHGDASGNRDVSDGHADCDIHARGFSKFERDERSNYHPAQSLPCGEFGHAVAQGLARA